MAYEVDIIAVGDESHSGDAIALRFGNFVQNPKDQIIVVIDGGFEPSGKKLVQRIRNEYKADRVNLVISTHPDNDHVSGLHVVLNELPVDQLWMHRPWSRSESINKKMMEEDGILAGLISGGTFKKSLESAYELEKLANDKGIPITEPFQGMSFGNALYVLGPSQDFYHGLMADFEKGTAPSVIEKAKRLMREVWHKDELVEPEDDAVSPRNNTSVVLLAQLGKDFLFTGDAGVLALNHAADYAAAVNYSLATGVHYHQVPHHGSKRNVGPTVLNRIIGPILPQGQKNGKTAFISAAAKGDPKHPSVRVTNALARRGAFIMATQGQDQCIHSSDVPVRPNWVNVKGIEFTSSYEEED